MIDSHVHIWDPQMLAYPWLKAVPALNAAYTLQQHDAQVADLGLVGRVLVEADVASADQDAEAQLMCKLADETSNRVIAVVAAARPEDTNFVEQLRRGAHPRRVGIRRVLHVVDDDVSRAPLFRRHVALLADHGLSFDICMRADQLPLAQELVQGAPATRFILDHGGNPPLGQPDGLNRWREEVSRLSQHANVVCKLSGLVNHLPAGANALEVLQPIVNHLLTCFGWQRLLFGSDWPVCTLANLDVPAWLDMARRLTAHLPEAASQAIFTTNALCVYQQEQKSV